MRTSDRLREAVRSAAFASTTGPEAKALARAVVDKGGSAVLAVIFFGSRKTRASPDIWSGYDFFVVTRDYPGFYASLKAAGSLRRNRHLVSTLNALLPPNQISIREAGREVGPLAKCAVISLATLQRETSERRRDHFCAGRLFQPTEVLYSRDADTRERILDVLVGAHALTLSWVRPWLPATFGVETYCQTLLRVSLGREIRPEPTGRSDALWDAQSEYLTPTYAILLEDLVSAGDLRPGGGDGLYALTKPLTTFERFRTALYFRWSMLRATARWFKYMATFDDWLEYIVHKAQRHSTRPIVLTARERRLPLVFLWPRLIRYLRDKNR